MEQKTPLYEKHVALGGKIVPFAGYLLPVQYEGVIAEHMAVRKAVGLFDVSHMGEIILSGPGALDSVNNIFANDFTSLEVGRVRYSVMLNEQGGIVDDLIIYRLGQERYMAVPNAANRQKDFAHIQKHLVGETTATDVSEDYAQLALQGPAAQTMMEGLTDASSIPQKYYSFTENAVVAGVKCILSRTGYTGEDGFELYCAPENAEKLWDALLEAGKSHGIVPCGLGARDTLRLEASMPLYGHEMNDEISPLETGLSFSVKMKKPPFVGKAALEAKGEPAIYRVGLKMTGRGIAREDCPVFAGGKQIGHTTSGTHCPHLGGAYAMALVAKGSAEPGEALEVEIRGKRVSAEAVSLPFYKRS